MIKGVDYIGVGVGAIILDSQGRIFMAKRGNRARNEVGKWEFPGGGVEFGERREEAIVREMKEEFGITVDDLEFMEVNDHIIPDEKQHWVTSAFICRIKQGVPKILEQGKLDEIGWFGLSEIEKLPLSLVTVARLQTLKNKYKERLHK